MIPKSNFILISKHLKKHHFSLARVPPVCLINCAQSWGLKRVYNWKIQFWERVFVYLSGYQQHCNPIRGKCDKIGLAQICSGGTVNPSKSWICDAAADHGGAHQTNNSHRPTRHGNLGHVRVVSSLQQRTNNISRQKTEVVSILPKRRAWVVHFGGKLVTFPVTTRMQHNTTQWATIVSLPTSFILDWLY